MKFFYSSLIISCILYLFVSQGAVASESSPESSDNSTRIYQSLLPLHEIKRLPGPYDWLAQHNERGQGVDDYQSWLIAKPDNTGEIIYMILLGEFTVGQTKIIDQVSRFISVYYQKPVQFIDPIESSEIPENAQRINPQQGMLQFKSRYIIDELLVPRRPSDAYALIAFSAVDLWPGQGWNFVFGEASMDEHVGVWSIARYGDPMESLESYQQVLMRSLKVGTHELGHMFGLDHCIFYECNLNGSNHQTESDSQPLYLCPVDLRKLQMFLGFDLKQRFSQLKTICEEFGLQDEAEYYERAIDLIGQADE